MRGKQPEATIAQPKSDEQQRGTEQSPLIVKIAPAPETEGQRADETKERERIAESDRKKEKSDADLVEYTGELASFTKYLVGATVALVIATIGLGVAAYYQSRDMKRSIEISDETAKATLIAAKAAENTLGHMRETAERQLRAHVFISRAEISNIMRDQKLTAKIIVKNFGQTPAYKVASSLGIVPAPFPLVVPLPPEVQRTRNANIGPGGEITLNFSGDEPVAVEWQPRFIEKSGAVYVYGAITYVDAFKIPRFTNFRLYKGGDTDVTGPELNFTTDDNEAS
jgi:hypothetical protein